MPSHGRRPCASAKRHLLVLLSNHQYQDWAQTCAEEIDDILNGNILRDVLSCPCTECEEGRSESASVPGDNEISTWIQKTGTSKRLFATCIIADRPFLIYPFLRSDFDDIQFNESITETELMVGIGLSLEDAKCLLSWKEAFFDGGRISLFTYIRRTKRRGDRPTTEERNWIIDELLTLMEKLSLAPDAPARKLPLTGTIKDITIRDSLRRPLDREEQAITNLGDQRVCMQSLGYLVLDLIWFIAGGAQCVHTLDKHRTPEVDWVKETDWMPLNQIPDLAKAFQLVWIMISPNEDFGLSKDDHGNDNFRYVLRQFRRIWPHTTIHPLTDPDKEKNSDLTSLSSRGLGSSGNNTYEEIEPNTFRWMLVRYQREGQGQKRCRLTVFKSTHNASIRLDILSFDYDAISPSSYYSSTENLRFIPLYAYGHHNGLNEFSAKFQLLSNSSLNLTIPYVFTFQSIEDVKLFQNAMTGRIVEKDVDVDHLSIRFRKKRRVGTGRPESLHFNLGRVQLWRILDEGALEEVHRKAQMGVRGVKEYPLRAEIALFSDHALIVIGIRSYLKLVDLPNFGLLIKTEEDTRAASLEGRRLRTDDDSPVYPGLPLFQLSSFDSHQEGEKVICESIELKFSSKRTRDDLSQYLKVQYNRSHSHANV